MADQSGFKVVDKEQRMLKAGKDFVKQLDDEGLAHSFTRDEIDNIPLEPGQRLLLIRTKYGSHEPLLYVVNRDTLPPKLRDQYKYAYVYDSRDYDPKHKPCNYYSTRPIWWDTVKDNPERQEHTVGFDDENEDLI